MSDYRCDICKTVAWEGIIQHPEVIGEKKKCCPDCYSEAMITYPESDDWKTRNIKELGLVPFYLRALAKHNSALAFKIYKDTGCVEVYGMHPCILCDQLCEKPKIECVRPCG